METQKTENCNHEKKNPEKAILKNKNGAGGIRIPE